MCLLQLIKSQVPSYGLHIVSLDIFDNRKKGRVLPLRVRVWVGEEREGGGRRNEYIKQKRKQKPTKTADLHGHSLTVDMLNYPSLNEA